MPQLIVVSAETGLLLSRYLLEIAAGVVDAAGQPDAFLGVVQTLNLARRRRTVSCAVVASSLDELGDRFRSAAAALAANPLIRGNLDRDTVIGPAARSADLADPVAFLCPGQGMQKVGLLRDWLELPVFAAAMQEMEAAVRDITPRPLLSYLYAPDATEDALMDTAIAQPAMFAIGVAVARVLTSYGVQPAVVLGHSLGEFTAAALSGGADAVDTIRFVARRGAAMAAMPGDHGAMAAVMAVPSDLAPHLPANVVIANRNHPRQNVIAGPTAAVEEAVRRLGEAQIKARRIPVSHAFHSPMLEVVQGDVDSGLADVRFAAPALKMASCIAAAAASSADDVRAIFRRHATSPVEYVRGLVQCREAGARIYVQLSGGATLTAFARGVLEAGEAIVSVAAEATLDPQRVELGHDNCLGLVRVLALCAAHGHAVDLSSFGFGLASLPPVPLLTQEYWGVQASAQGSGAAMQLAGLAQTDAAGQSSAQPDLPATGQASAHAELLPEGDVRARVLRVVARVSAFPVDALKSEQRLLDDLGFDSLMVNELAGRLTEDFPGFGGIPRSLFAKNPTVLDLVNHVERSTAEQDVPLTDPSRPMEILAVTAAEAPLSGLTLPAPVRVLDQPSLDVLRALKPQDLVVRVRTEQAIHEESRPWALRDELAAAAGTIGFVKALAREWPQHKVQVVCGELHDAEVEAGAVERDPEVLVLSGVRFVRALTGAALDARPLSLHGERVLLTGGTGWLGGVLARALLSAGADEVILLGSRPDAGEALAELGSRVRYIQADLLTDASLDAVKTLGITHLVHAAGSLADGPVGTVDRALRDRAWALKVSALGNLLLALTENGHGRLGVTAIGSYAGFFGNAYQTEYAAANAAMSAVIRESRVSGGVQIWGPWDGSDMVGTIPAAMKREMRDEGVWFVDRDRGAEAFLAALRARGDVVIGLDLPLVRRVVEVRETYTPDMPWLVDHALYGKPTVPMAVVADDALRLGSAVLGAGQGALELVDLTLFDGITVEKPVTVRRRIDGAVFTVWTGDRLAWKARLQPSAAAAPAPVGDTSEAASAFDIATFYRDHTFHGPLLQGMVAIEAIGDAHVRGRVRIGSPGDWGLSVGCWHFSPLAVDAAFQLAAVWAIQKKGRAGFPVRVARWTQRPMDAVVSADGALSVVGVFRDADADRFRGDVWLVDDTGAIVAHGEGVEAELRQVPAGPASAQQAPASEPIPERFWNFAKFPEFEDLDQRLSAALMLGIDNPYFKTLDGCARDTVTIEGRELIHFSGYNYLGFSGHPYVEQRVMEAVRRYGTSVSASRVASGERPIHAELEAHLARALDVEAALVFTAGHATNVTTIGHLFGPKDLLLHDELIHDSVFQGMKLSGATRRPFPHGDSAALGRMLAQLRQHYEKVCIIVEGVYSMDGDICDLPAFVALKKQHQCFLMVDEAHSFGVVGSCGLGVREHFNVPGGDVDIWMGTLSKTLSSCGGYIGGTQTLITLLKYTAPGFIFSAGLTPANAAAALAALELMEREPETVKKLQTNAAFFYAECQRHGLDNGPAAGHSAVIPVIVGNSFHALLLSDALKKAGVNVQPILYPAVADNASRLRFFLSSLHSPEQLAHTADIVARELQRIRAENPI
ncbi:MAG: aminotransferase class I/II-fold pyridoxal phosphate-dependent enzyme [Myxococcales bacterium]|nr:aminotransferase class I/II-fold pyridoxal phosphate-dependent enzyme [Myxococcales bacterium]